MKFIHTADWQLGRVYQFEGSGEGHDPAATLSAARFDAIERIAALAASEGIDAVLVAGDIFDKPALSDHTLRRAVHAMAAFSGRWILLPGNHDAALAQGVWERLRKLNVLTPNITIADEPRAYEFPEAGFAVLAAPLTQRQTHTDLTQAFDTLQTPSGLIRIGLAHGSVTGILAADIDSPNPIETGRAQSAKLDYLALGDWHGLKQVDARTWYSGTPEQDRFKANDPGHVLLVAIDAPGALPQVESRRIGRFAWRQDSFEILGASDTDQLEKFLNSLQDTDIVTLTVKGQTDFASAGKIHQLLEAAKARAHVLEAHLDDLRLEPTEADLATMKVDGALANVVEELRTLQQQPDDAATANEALKILFDLLQQQEVRA